MPSNAGEPLPHSEGQHLERVLEERVALGGRREAPAVGAVLLREPPQTDTTQRPPAGEHVEGGGDLPEVGDVPVGDPGDERAEPDPLGHPGQEGERGPALEHVLPGAAEHRDLAEVVHHPDAPEAGLLGGGRDGGEARPQLGRAAGPRPHRDLQPEAEPDRRLALLRGQRRGAGHGRRRDPHDDRVQHGVEALGLEARPLLAHPAHLRREHGVGHRLAPRPVAGAALAHRRREHDGGGRRPCRRASRHPRGSAGRVEAERVDDGRQPAAATGARRSGRAGRTRPRSPPDPPRPHRPPPAAGRSTPPGPGRSARPPTTTCPTPTRPPAPPGTGKAAGWPSPAQWQTGTGARMWRRLHLGDTALVLRAVMRCPPLRNAEIAFALAVTSEAAFTVTLGVVSFRSGGAAGRRPRRPPADASVRGRDRPDHAVRRPHRPGAGARSGRRRPRGRDRGLRAAARVRRAARDRLRAGGRGDDRDGCVPTRPLGAPAGPVRGHRRADERQRGPGRGRGGRHAGGTDPGGRAADGDQPVHHDTGDRCGLTGQRRAGARAPRAAHDPTGATGAGPPRARARRGHPHRGPPARPAARVRTRLRARAPCAAP